MFKQPFMIAVALSVVGMLPFVILCFTVLLSPVEARSAIEMLISYGAVVLSFTGAVHWGFALRDTAHPVNGAPLPPVVLGAERQLLLFGPVPAIIGWLALSIMLHFRLTALALFMILGGFFITIVAETIGRGRGVVAANYLVLRWSVSVVVLLSLVVVLGAVLTGMRVA